MSKARANFKYFRQFREYLRRFINFHKFQINFISLDLLFKFKKFYFHKYSYKQIAFFFIYDKKYQRDWHLLLQSIKQSVSEVFSTKALVTDVSNGVFDYLLAYIHRLHKIIDSIGDSSLMPTPSLHQIVLEIKRMKVM